MEIKQLSEINPTIIKFGVFYFNDENVSYIIQSLATAGYIVSYVGEQGNHNQKFFRTLVELDADIEFCEITAALSNAKEDCDDWRIKKLTQQRNKLNRQISSLKKASLQAT